MNPLELTLIIVCALLGGLCLLLCLLLEGKRTHAVYRQDLAENRARTLKEVTDNLQAKLEVERDRRFKAEIKVSEITKILEGEED